MSAAHTTSPTSPSSINKMVKMTRWLNIVCPNKETVENLRDKTTAWIESRGGPKQLQNVRVRITTLKRLEGQSKINVIPTGRSFLI